MNKSNVLAVGVLLISLGLYLQTTYNIEGNQIGEYLKTLDVNTFTLLVTVLFWGGLIVVIVSILIRPKKRKIVVPEEPVKADYRRRVAYSVEEPVEPVDTAIEQPYVEEAEPVEEPEAEEEALEKEALETEEEEKPGKVREVVGFCPRCGAPVTEGIRYCRKCGLKLK
ncbi:MAG: zinc ribbon domain-containing protein [Thermoproteota archaeon]